MGFYRPERSKVSVTTRTLTTRRRGYVKPRLLNEARVRRVNRPRLGPIPPATASLREQQMYIIRQQAEIMRQTLEILRGLAQVTQRLDRIEGQCARLAPLLPVVPPEDRA